MSGDRISPAVRPVVMAELEELLRVAREAPAGEHTRARPWTRAEFEAELGRAEACVLGAFSAEEGAGLLGYLIYWLVAGEVQILDVATRGDARRRGVARALLTDCLARGRRAAAIEATLELRRGNAPALALYQSHGFLVVGERTGYYAEDGEDALLMTLTL